MPRALGPISILVNNAGINKPTDFDKISDLIGTTSSQPISGGPFICAQVFLPLLAKAERQHRHTVRSAVSMAARAPRTMPPQKPGSSRLPR